MKTKKVLFYGLAALMAGCVPVVSLHPLVSSDNLAFDERLIGVWVDEPETTWEFARATSADAEALPDGLGDAVEKAYRLDFRDDEGRKGAFLACLVKLDDKLFLDVFPRTFPSGEEEAEKTDLPYNTLFFVRAHSFVRVLEIGNQLKMRLTDDEAFKKLIEAEPNAVASTSVDGTAVLTASSESLRAFALKHADDDRFFTNEVVLTRKP
ncbi:MAG: hypothetical protein JW993_12520 [Sedimentisphaerales bacterium]|nr:hypothetical protein [Sedimentisphaerales bacterium]